jgi:ribosomal protein S27E
MGEEELMTNQEKLEELLRQAAEDSIIEIQCPECGDTITAEPDAEEFHCQGCGKTMKNPLASSGLI